MSEASKRSKKCECVCAEINTRHCPVHGQGVFSGNVLLAEVVYAPEAYSLTDLDPEEFDAPPWPGYEC